MIKSRLPTMQEAVEIIGMQLSKSGQARQLRYMEETQGREFAEQVKAKVIGAGKGRKK